MTWNRVGTIEIAEEGDKLQIRTRLPSRIIQYVVYLIAGLLSFVGFVWVFLSIDYYVVGKRAGLPWGQLPCGLTCFVLGFYVFVKCSKRSLFTETIDRATCTRHRLYRWRVQTIPNVVAVRTEKRLFGHYVVIEPANSRDIALGYPTYFTADEAAVVAQRIAIFLNVETRAGRRERGFATLPT